MRWLTYMDLATPIGGAQSMDRDMISQAPEAIEVINTVPEGNDPLIVSGTAWLRDWQKLKGKDFIYWPHDTQEGNAAIYDWARVVVWTTPDHLDWGERHGLFGKVNVLNPSWFDTSKFWPGDKKADLLWAHRNVWHKGLDQAIEWARKEQAELTVLTNVSRETFAEAMAVHKRFILLSQQIYDPAPLTVMEAQLSGCELVLNDLVGFWQETPDELRARIDGAAKEFWSLP